MSVLFLSFLHIREKIRENHTIVTVPDQEALDVNGDVCMTVGTKFIKRLLSVLKLYQIILLSGAAGRTYQE